MNDHDAMSGHPGGDGHERLAARLSEHMDGLLAGDEARAVERHLEACAECRRTLDELAAVREAARVLVDRPPRRDLWPGIRSAILEPRVVPLHGDGASRVRSPRGRGLFLSLPQLAAAAVVLVALGGIGAWSFAPGLAGGPGAEAGTASPGGEAPATLAATGSRPGSEIGSGYAAEVERLEGLLDRSRERLSPATVRVLEKNLGIIDRAILESMQALESDPANPWVRDHLRRSWERKVDYLRQATELAEWSSAD